MGSGKITGSTFNSQVCNENCKNSGIVSLKDLGKIDDEELDFNLKREKESEKNQSGT